MCIIQLIALVAILFRGNNLVFISDSLVQKSDQIVNSRPNIFGPERLRSEYFETFNKQNLSSFSFRCILIKDSQEIRHHRNLQKALLEIQLTEK